MNEPMSREASRLVRALEADRPSSEARARMRARMLAASATAATVSVASTAAGQGATAAAKGASAWLGLKLVVATLVVGAAITPFARPITPAPRLEVVASPTVPALVMRAPPVVHAPRVALSANEAVPMPQRNQLAAERALLARALRALHASEFDVAERALVRHRRRFPNGALAPERARIEQHVNEARGAMQSGDGT